MTTTLDATIVIAIIGLLGTIYTAKTNTIIKMNEQLMEILESSQKELHELKQQHANETDRLEKKISILTKENEELRDKINELTNKIIELKNGLIKK